ncbi:hypothetical protein SFR_7048 (plasmid) [Streptomyces sp. FR-008]|nr:hypothetical protein SFR_7048 [Streptomyces sp. FR-008]
MARLVTGGDRAVFVGPGRGYPCSGELERGEP